MISRFSRSTTDREKRRTLLNILQLIWRRHWLTGEVRLQTVWWSEARRDEHPKATRHVERRRIQLTNESVDFDYQLIRCFQWRSESWEETRPTSCLNMSLFRKLIRTSNRSFRRSTDRFNENKFAASQHTCCWLTGIESFVSYADKKGHF
jgi:hypothetical protein